MKVELRLVVGREALRCALLAMAPEIDDLLESSPELMKQLQQATVAAVPVSQLLDNMLSPEKRLRIDAVATVQRAEARQSAEVTSSAWAASEQRLAAVAEAAVVATATLRKANDCCEELLSDALAQPVENVVFYQSERPAGWTSHAARVFANAVAGVQASADASDGHTASPWPHRLGTTSGVETAEQKAAPVAEAKRLTEAAKAEQKRLFTSPPALVRVGARKTSTSRRLGIAGKKRGISKLTPAVKAQWVHPTCWNKGYRNVRRPEIKFDDIPCFKQRLWGSVADMQNGIIGICGGDRKNASFKVQGPLDLFAAPGGEKLFRENDFKACVEHWVTMGESQEPGVVGKRHMLALTLYPDLFDRTNESWNTVEDDDPLKDIKNYVKGKVIKYSVAMNAMNRLMGYNFAIGSTTVENWTVVA